MLGKIKWILFTVLVIVILITVVLFINFNREHNQIDIGNEVKDIFDKKWYKIDTKIYENGVLTADAYNYIEGYIIFTEDKINYCNSNTDCEEYDYNYENGVIEMPIDKYVLKGEYVTQFDDDYLDLIYENEGYKVIYHFETAKG